MTIYLSIYTFIYLSWRLDSKLSESSKQAKLNKDTGILISIYLSISIYPNTYLSILEAERQ